MAQLDKTAKAKAALRHLESTFIRKLDPGIVYELYSKDILTFSEKEEVEAGKSNSERNSAIMRALGRKEPISALETLIEALEGEDGVDKQANSYLLKKIAEGIIIQIILFTAVITYCKSDKSIEHTILFEWCITLPHPT